MKKIYTLIAALSIFGMANAQTGCKDSLESQYYDRATGASITGLQPSQGGGFICGTNYISSETAILFDTVKLQTTGNVYPVAMYCLFYGDAGLPGRVQATDSIDAKIYLAGPDGNPS